MDTEYLLEYVLIFGTIPIPFVASLGMVFRLRRSRAQFIRALQEKNYIAALKTPAINMRYVSEVTSFRSPLLPPFYIALKSNDLVAARISLELANRPSTAYNMSDRDRQTLQNARIYIDTIDNPELLANSQRTPEDLLQELIPSYVEFWQAVDHMLVLPEQVRDKKSRRAEAIHLWFIGLLSLGGVIAMLIALPYINAQF